MQYHALNIKFWGQTTSKLFVKIHPLVETNWYYSPQFWYIVSLYSFIQNISVSWYNPLYSYNMVSICILITCWIQLGICYRHRFDCEHCVCCLASKPQLHGAQCVIERAIDPKLRNPHNYLHYAVIWYIETGVDLTLATLLQHIKNQ